MSRMSTDSDVQLEVDRDYMGVIGEDVQFRIWDDFDVDLSLSPEKARELARLLIHHADEVDEINKEADRG